MKKLLLLVILFAVPSFAQETKSSSAYTRFGMDVLPLPIPLTGVGLSAFPLSFYLANQQNQVLSFGFDYAISAILPSIQLGAHFGFGKMKATSYNPNLNIGYLLDFSAGYSTPSLLVIPFYIGFSPNMILEIDRFFFKAGVYVNTSLAISANLGFGFLLD